MVKINIIDGARSIGGSKIHLQSGCTGLLLDFGINYNKWGLYYEEFVGPRTARGINDPIRLRLLPYLGNLYRDDIIPDDLYAGDYFRETKQVDAVFVSHAHMDHCGHIGVLREDIPIYCSAMTAVIMKAMQDVSGSEIFSENVYLTKREKDDGGRLIKSPKNKVSAIGRKFFLFGEINEKLRCFWELSPWKSKSLISLPPQIAGEVINDVPVKFFPLDHSIPGASGYAFETEEGWVIYTGDLRKHGKNRFLTEKFIEEASKLRPLALIIEGTRLSKEEKNEHSEEEVHDRCLEEVKKAEGKLVIADFSPRHLERLFTFLDIAKQTNRKLAVLMKDIYLLQATETVQPTNVFEQEELCIFEQLKASSLSAWEEKILKGFADRIIKIEEVQKNQGDYILCLSFYDINSMTDITCEEGSIYIYSSSEAYEEEQDIDFWRLNNWLKFLGLKPIGFQVPEQSENARKPKPYFPPGYHCSGHASKEDLLHIVRCIRPKYLIPVHTENPSPYLELKGITHIILEDEKNNDLEVIFSENA